MASRKGGPTTRRSIPKSSVRGLSNSGSVATIREAAVVPPEVARMQALLWSREETVETVGRNLWPPANPVETGC